MEVILLRDIEKVGLRGDVVSVARGYARNFLLPRGLAEEATKARVAELAKRDSQRARHEAKTADEASAIADTLAKTVNVVYADPSKFSGLALLIATYFFTFQIYCDFSGYSDMAVGLAYLLGFRFPQNFNSPFKAVNISDFWRRWHMTLSFWLRDYLFIPLGGSRHGRLRTLRNLAITMFVGGLWHGAAFTFVVWGLLHGAYLVVHNLCRNLGLTPRSIALNRALTFVCVVAAFVIFRAPNLGDAWDVLRAMAGLNGLDAGRAGVRLLVGIAALVAFVNLAPNTWEVRLRWRPAYGLVLGFAAIALISWQSATSRASRAPVCTTPSSAGSTPRCTITG